MKSNILYIFTRTPLHVGAGSSVGAVDLPVQRERHSRHPIIPGSSIKGVLRYTCETIDKLAQDKVDDLFGPGPDVVSTGGEARAGDLTFGEARPLAFPVRSAKGSFAYVTCPVALQRWARDAGVTGDAELEHPKDQTCLAGHKVTLAERKKVVLEEYAFSHTGDFPAEWQNAIQAVIDDPVWREAAGRLVLLSDGDFSHFVATSTEISHHNKIDPKTGAVADGALFNIESVPAETLFFAPVSKVGRYEQTDSIAELSSVMDNHPVFQFGGHSSTGLGFCSVKLG